MGYPSIELNQSRNNREILRYLEILKLLVLFLYFENLKKIFRGEEEEYFGLLFGRKK